MRNFMIIISMLDVQQGHAKKEGRIQKVIPKILEYLYINEFTRSFGYAGDFDKV